MVNQIIVQRWTTEQDDKNKPLVRIISTITFDSPVPCFVLIFYIR